MIRQPARAKSQRRRGLERWVGGQGDGVTSSLIFASSRLLLACTRADRRVTSGLGTAACALRAKRLAVCFERRAAGR